MSAEPEFLSDWAKEGDKKTSGLFPFCVRNYTVNSFSITGNIFEPSLVYGLCTGAAAHTTGVAQLNAESPAPAPLTWQGHYSGHWSCGRQPETGLLATPPPLPLFPAIVSASFKLLMKHSG